MKKIIASDTVNWFESDVLDSISRSKLAGVVTNNFFVPHHVRQYPNEHDVVVLLPGRVVTIEAKALDPGSYRRGSGCWEELGKDGEWRQLRIFGALTDPDRIRRQKLKVMKGHIQQLMGAHKGPSRLAEPEVISCVVVPDHADISAISHGPDAGRDYVTNLSGLEAILRQEAGSGTARPSPAELEALLRLDTIPVGRAPDEMIGDLRVIRYLPVPSAPFPRIVLVGEHEFDVPGKTPERETVEFCMRYGVSQEGHSHVRHEFITRAFWTNSEAQYQAAESPAVLRRKHGYFTPLAAVFHYEFFSTETLADLMSVGPLSWQDVRKIFKELVAGLKDLHTMRVFHRHIEPACILVNLDKQRPSRIFGFWGGKALDVQTVGVRVPPGPFMLPNMSPDTNLALVDAYAIGKCIIAALAGPNGIIDAARVPEGVVELLMKLTDSSERERSAAWDSLDRVLARG